LHGAPLPNRVSVTSSDQPVSGYKGS
jgi:hypothetical protein